MAVIAGFGTAVYGPKLEQLRSAGNEEWKKLPMADITLASVLGWFFIAFILHAAIDLAIFRVIEKKIIFDAFLYSVLFIVLGTGLLCAYIGPKLEQQVRAEYKHLGLMKISLPIKLIWFTTIFTLYIFICYLTVRFFGRQIVVNTLLFIVVAFGFISGIVSSYAIPRCIQLLRREKQNRQSSTSTPPEQSS